MKKKTTIYLGETDRKAIEAIKQHYHLTGESAAIRLSLALTALEISQKEHPRAVQPTTHSENL